MTVKTNNPQPQAVEKKDKNINNETKTNLKIKSKLASNNKIKKDSI